MFVEEVEHDELVEEHAVADVARRKFEFVVAALFVDLGDELLGVVPGQHFSILVLLGHVLEEAEESGSQGPGFLRVFIEFELVVGMSLLLLFELIDEMWRLRA